MRVVHDELLGQLPLFNLDLGAESPLSVVSRWRAQLAACDAILIACPEYAFSLPGALKNGIDWVVGSGELEGKLIAATALVAGPPRGLRGLQALLEPLSALSCRIAWSRPIARAERNDALAELLDVLRAAHTGADLGRLCDSGRS